MSFEAQFIPSPFTLRTLEKIEGVITGVARSIESLDAGTYGKCEHCGVEIRKQALVENPLVVRCDAHLVTARPALFAIEGEPAEPGESEFTDESEAYKFEADEFDKRGFESDQTDGEF